MSPPLWSLPVLFVAILPGSTRREPVPLTPEARAQAVGVTRTVPAPIVGRVRNNKS